MAGINGPFTLEETTEPVKLQGPTMRIKAKDGTLVLAASTQGNRAVRNEIEGLVDKALAALNADAKKSK